MMMGKIILLDFDHTGNGNGNSKAWNFSCHWLKSRFEIIFKELMKITEKDITNIGLPIVSWSKSSSGNKCAEQH